MRQTGGLGPGDGGSIVGVWILFLKAMGGY